MGKKGMTLVMLVIYIVVLLILAGISISTVVADKNEEIARSESFKSLIIQYVEQFNTSKDLYKIENNDKLKNVVIEGNDLLEYIPSINLEQTKYLVIENGELKYNTVVAEEYRENEYLKELADEGIIGKYTP